MTNIVKKYFRILEVISSLNFGLKHKISIGRKKMSYLEVVELSLRVDGLANKSCRKG